MNKWIMLGAAIASEVMASLSLKGALTQPLWYALVVAGYLAAFTFISLSLRGGMGLGVAYGIWGALGVALTALLAAAIFHEPITPVMMTGLALIIGGVLIVELGAQRAQPGRKGTGEGEAQ
ncbi:MULTISPECIES: SMR family transporter [unclassified Leifsonia]|uniref:DMT family transporter n=1 Tax=unclassified Leifsonia TaxID=2663824 RepID=UPI0008A7D547|nr:MULTISPECIES: SMR family transporter [unclassified Leifsonia]SEI14692.1 small multidrug resistance pump [Leifsonia sp. CL154]SFM02426.1 small multidrug resistance pump [Leifsonia sp. CL147]